MGLFDTILSQAGQHADVGNMASKLGISPDLAEKAVAALGQSYVEPGDTIAGAAAKTGLDTDMLEQIVQQIGGEGSLGQYAQALQDNPAAAGVFKFLDRDGDGNPLNDVLGMVGKLFGKN